MSNRSSKEFIDAFHSGFGSYCAECGCGRIYFAGNDTTWAETEKDRLDLIAKSEAEPTKYIDTGDCGTSLVNLGGALYVDGCACGTVARYENWVWTMRNPVIEYIKARTAKELAAAQKQAAALDGLQETAK